MIVRIPIDLTLVDRVHFEPGAVLEVNAVAWVVNEDADHIVLRSAAGTIWRFTPGVTNGPIMAEVIDDHEAVEQRGLSHCFVSEPA